MGSEGITNAPIDEEKRFEAPLPSGRWGRVMARIRELLRRRDADGDAGR
jgi:hypothetical protein